MDVKTCAFTLAIWASILFVVYYLRKHNHFSEVHQLVTCKVSDDRRPTGPIARTAFYTSMNFKKMKFTSYIYILILYRFYSLFVKVLIKILQNKRRVRLLRSTAVSMT